MQNLVKRVIWGHLTHFWNFVTPYYLGNGWSEIIQIWHGDGGQCVLTKKNAKLGQKWSRGGL